MFSHGIWMKHRDSEPSNQAIYYSRTASFILLKSSIIYVSVDPKFFSFSRIRAQFRNHIILSYQWRRSSHSSFLILPSSQRLHHYRIDFMEELILRLPPLQPLPYANYIRERFSRPQILVPVAYKSIKNCPRIDTNRTLVWLQRNSLSFAHIHLSRRPDK